MLVNLTEILEIAKKNKNAIGAFNTPNLECINAVISAAEKLDVPVIISHAQLHENVSPLDIIGPIMIDAANKSKVPVCVHLDHCESLDYLQRSLDLGFTGVMYDGSLLPYKQNLDNTKKAVEMIKNYNCAIEAELGALPSREDGSDSGTGGPIYTDPTEAVNFCNDTGIDVLAPSFGTAHGIYKSKPVLNLDLVKTIAMKTGLPLVMHGGSGVSHKDYKIAINNGIRKVNYYSYMSKAGVAAAENMLKLKDITFFHDLALAAQKAMEEDASKALLVFSELN